MLTYSGSAATAFAEYLLAVLAASVFDPAMGALGTDLSRPASGPLTRAG
jgi:hypothetical protein